MSSAAGLSPAEAPAKIALLGVDDASAGVLTECFRQFGVQASLLPLHQPGAMAGSFDGCVLPLTAEAEPVLRELRSAGRHLVIFGMCGSIREALRFSNWGINAVFYTPLREREAMQVVRSTHLLVVKELRRYVRVPLVCPVTLETGAQVVEASTIEISAGGMSLATRAPLRTEQPVLANFALPDAGAISVRAVVCWARNEEGSAAIRFDLGDTRRGAVRQWIDEYLGA